MEKKKLRLSAVLSSLLLCASCTAFSNLVGDSKDVKMPVDDSQKIIDWASNFPKFDLDSNGYLDSREVDQFLIWLGFQIANEYLVTNEVNQHGNH